MSATLLHPETAKEALDRWDKGEILFTVEMGGLGPSYEQVIQVLVFEMIRDNLTVVLPPESSDEFEAFSASFGDTAVNRTNDKMGYSGAQADAAKTIAYRALRDGWRAMLESAPEDRLIQISKTFPTI